MFKEVNELVEAFNVAETTLISRIQEDEEFTGNIAERLLLKYIYRVSLNYFYFSKQKNGSELCLELNNSQRKYEVWQKLDTYSILLLNRQSFWVVDEF